MSNIQIPIDAISQDDGNLDVPYPNTYECSNMGTAHVTRERGKHGQ